jgi:hypothetical protein
MPRGNPDPLHASRDMKVHNVASALLAVCLVAFASCKKSEQSVTPNTEFNGVKVEWPKLETEFGSGDQEMQRAASLAVRHIRYSQLPDAVGDLERLSGDPKLTEPQKKVVTDLLEQVKQALAKAPAPGQ